MTPLEELTRDAVEAFAEYETAMAGCNRAREDAARAVMAAEKRVNEARASWLTADAAVGEAYAAQLKAEREAVDAP